MMPKRQNQQIMTVATRSQLRFCTLPDEPTTVLNSRTDPWWLVVLWKWLPPSSIEAVVAMLSPPKEDNSGAETAELVVVRMIALDDVKEGELASLDVDDDDDDDDDDPMMCSSLCRASWITAYRSMTR